MQVYVGLKHCRALGYCLFAVRRWCTRYDIDFKKLAHCELPVEVIEETGDALAKRVADLARSTADGR